MNYQDDIPEDDFFRDIRRIRKNSKDDILDESFKKAEINKGIGSKEKKMLTKKPFLKLGVIFLIFMLIAILMINYFPWVYIKYDAEYGEVQEFFYKNFENERDFNYTEIDYIFKSPCTNCSNYTNNFIGIQKSDFTTTPKQTLNHFYILGILGAIFTIFAIVEKFKDFNKEFVSIIHSSFAMGGVLISIAIFLQNIKFLSFYLVFYNNFSFIEASNINNLIIIFLAPVIILFICFAIIIISSTVMKINFKDFEKIIKKQITKKSISEFKNRRKQ